MGVPQQLDAFVGGNPTKMDDDLGGPLFQDTLQEHGDLSDKQSDFDGFPEAFLLGSKYIQLLGNKPTNITLHQTILCFQGNCVSTNTFRVTMFR